MMVLSEIDEAYADEIIRKFEASKTARLTAILELTGRSAKPLDAGDFKELNPALFDGFDYSEIEAMAIQLETAGKLSRIGFEDCLRWQIT